MENCGPSLVMSLVKLDEIGTLWYLNSSGDFHQGKLNKITEWIIKSIVSELALFMWKPDVVLVVIKTYLRHRMETCISLW